MKPSPAKLAAPLAALALLASAANAQVFPSGQGPIELAAVATGLEHPWGLAFLPDGAMLVTERPGRLRQVSANGALSQPMTGVPNVYAGGQGGLLDVALDPRFAENRRVYLSYSEPGPGGAGVAVARGRLESGRLADVTVIFRQEPKLPTGLHFGSRFVFAADGRLFVTLGDRDTRPLVQDLSSHVGKVVRIEADGRVPAGNPFVGRPGARPEIWSLGHRNVQGAALDPRTGALWTAEHGARGGDEINQPRAGLNYGWPVISYGREYSFLPIGEGTAKPGMEQPVHYWDPSIAPSGMAIYTGDKFPAWRGHFFVGSLKFGRLVRLELKDAKVVKEERLLDGFNERVRDVRQGPDGLLYLLTDSPSGRLLRLSPAR
jgi:glucose/arabinose dehydrogenase